MTELTTLALSVDATGMKQGEQALDSIAEKAEQTEKRTNTALNKVDAGITKAGGAAKKAVAPMSDLGGKAMPQATSAANKLGPAVQNASYQIGDFAVQVASGQSAAIAFAQQFPQLAGGLGVWGAAIGAAVAVGAAVAPLLFDMGTKAVKLDDVMDDLASATDAYRRAVETLNQPTWQMIEGFGAGADAAREVLYAMVEIERIKFIQSMAAASTALGEALGGVRDSMKGWHEATQMPEYLRAESLAMIQSEVSRLETEFGLTAMQADKVAQALDGMEKAQSARETADAAAALGQALMDAQREGAKLPPELMEAAETAYKTSLKAREMAEMLEKSKDAASDLAVIDPSGGISAAARAAAMLASNLQTAVSLQQQLASGQYSGAAFAPDLERFGNPYEGDGAQAPTTSKRPKAAPMGTGGVDWGTPPYDRKARSGGGRTKTNSYEKDVFTIQKETEALLAQADAVAKIVAAGGDWEHALRVVEEEQQLLIEAQRAGVALTPEIKASIRSWAEEYVAAEDHLEGLKDKITDFADMQREVGAAFKSGFSEWISGAKSLQDALAGVISRLADMAASRAFDMLWDGGGKKGGGGGILGSFVSSIFGGFKASGGPVSSGKGYIVGEEGPEWFQPGASGTIVPNHALGGGGGGGVNIHIDARGAQHGVGAEIEAAVRQGMAQAVSAAVTKVGRNQSMGRPLGALT